MGVAAVTFRRLVTRGGFVLDNVRLGRYKIYATLPVTFVMSWKN